MLVSAKSYFVPLVENVLTFHVSVHAITWSLTHIMTKHLWLMGGVAPKWHNEFVQFSLAKSYSKNLNGIWLRKLLQFTDMWLSNLNSLNSQICWISWFQIKTDIISILCLLTTWGKSAITMQRKSRNFSYWSLQWESFISYLKNFFIYFFY